MENKAVLLNKYESIEKCIKRINEEYENNKENLYDYRRMDCIVLNLQRACEITIDIAMYIISTKKLGLPQTKKEAFDILEKIDIEMQQGIEAILKEEIKKGKKLLNTEYYNGSYVIIGDLEGNLKAMVGFRNIAIHEYKQIDEEILQDVIENHLNDLINFARKMYQD